MAKKILLIENNASICSLLQQWLIQDGYEPVVAAEGGDEGILLAVTEAPDLIVIDTDLPVIDGWQVVRILKASTVTQKIPIIILTDPVTETAWNRIVKSGCNACELKPIERTSILSKIKALTKPIFVSAESDPLLNDQDSFLFPKFGSVSAAKHSSSKGVIKKKEPFAPVVSHQPVVAYIEDSFNSSQVMADIVQQAGYGYKRISEPLRALPLLLDIRPKLIFLDLLTPLTNGYDMCDQIRRSSVFKEIPIVIVTDGDGIIDRVRARFVGASGFFSKPIKEERVLKVLKKWLDPSYASPAKSLYQRSRLPFI